MTTDFLNRWSQRKLASSQSKPELDEQPLKEPVFLINEPLTSELLEPADLDATQIANTSLDNTALLKPEQHSLEQQITVEKNELSMAELLLSETAEAVKKAALRKMFLAGDYHQVDMLDDYNQDFTKLKPLAVDVVAGLRAWLNDPLQEQEQEQEHSLCMETEPTPSLTLVDDDIAPAKIEN